jgi:hypothetical protein
MTLDIKEFPDFLEKHWFTIYGLVRIERLREGEEAN